MAEAAGTLLLSFGLQWLRKAILRTSGRLARHDEDAIYQRELAGSRSASAGAGGAMDWYAFTLAFKGVFLEGLEVVFIVLTFGANAAADGTGSIQLLLQRRGQASDDERVPGVASTAH